MYFYSAYGLRIQSDIALPELVASRDTVPDVVIRVGKVGRKHPEVDGSGSYYQLERNQAYCFWKRVGALLVRGGREIIIEPLPGVEESIVRLPLLGMGLAAVVQQRGLLALHASAVAMNGCALALLGGSGQGKSTTAAALYASGYVLVADDLLVLDLSGPSPRVLPGFPQLKLFPESAAAALNDGPESLVGLGTGQLKYGRRVPERFSLQPAALSGIYFLSFGPALEVERARPQDAIVQVIANSYDARVFTSTLKGLDAARNLAQCAALVDRVPAYWLRRPASLGALPQVVQKIEEQLTCLTA